MAKQLALEELMIADVVEPIPATILDDATLAEALGVMKKKGLHDLAVVGSKGELRGVLSDETLLKRRRLPLQSHVANLLVVPPRLTVEDTLARAAEALLAGGFREMPVWDAGGKALAGQVTRWGLLGVLQRDGEIAALPAHAVMTPDPMVVSEQDTIDHAIDEMRRLDEPTIPVVDKAGELTGVVSARDILRLYAGWAAQAHIPKGSPKRETREKGMTVAGVMTSPIVEATRDTKVEDLARLMMESKASSVVISEEGRPKGIVTKGDLLDLIASLVPREGCFLQVTGLEGHDPFLLEDVFRIVEPRIQKIAAYAKPMSFNAHVMEHHRTYGHRAEVRARLQTDRGLLTATSEDDDLLRAVDSVLDKLESQARREKERRRPNPNKARAGQPPRGRAKLG